MPALGYWKRRTGCELGSRALVVGSVETWVSSYLCLALFAGVGLHELFGWWADPVGALPCSGHHLARLGKPRRGPGTRGRR